MTKEEIDSIFPESYGGNAQISDLRLVLSKIASDGQLNGIDFYDVPTIADRDALNANQADICKVHDDGTGNSQTYIYDHSVWKILVESTGGGGSPTGTKITENFTVTTLDEQAQIIQLQHIPKGTEHLFVFLNGMYLMQGVNYDYTLSSSSIQFNTNVLTAGDNLAIKYTY